MGCFGDRHILRLPDRSVRQRGSRCRKSNPPPVPPAAVEQAAPRWGDVRPEHQHPRCLSAPPVGNRGVLSRCTVIPTFTLWPGMDHPGVSNGPNECLNLKVKNTKRADRGYRSFANYRLRLLLNHGLIRDDQATTRIRTPTTQVRCVEPEYMHEKLRRVEYLFASSRHEFSLFRSVLAGYPALDRRTGDACFC